MCVECIPHVHAITHTKLTNQLINEVITQVIHQVINLAQAKRIVVRFINVNADDPF